MIIHKIPYDCLYELFLEDFIKKLLFTDEITQNPPKSKKNFEITREISTIDKVRGERLKTKVSVAVYSFKKVGDPTIFSRTKYDLASKGEKEFDPALLVEMLQFIGIKHPINLERWDIKDPEEKAQILYQVFIEKECKSFFKLHPELVVFDNNNEILSDIKEELSIGIVVDDIPKNATEKKYEDSEVITYDEITELEKLVKKYCNYVCDKDIDVWKIFTPTFKADWESSIHNFLNAIDGIQELRNPSLFGFVRTFSQRLGFELQDVEKHISFKVFYTQISTPKSTSFYKTYWACKNKDLHDNQRIEYYREFLLSESKYQSAIWEDEDEYLRRNFSFEKYFENEPRFLLQNYSSEKLYLEILEKEFDRIDKFQSWFTYNQLPFDGDRNVAYDKVEWWDCVFSNGKWHIDNIKQHDLNKPYPHIRFGRPIYKKI